MEEEEEGKALCNNTQGTGFQRIVRHEEDQRETREGVQQPTAHSVCTFQIQRRLEQPNRDFYFSDEDDDDNELAGLSFVEDDESSVGGNSAFSYPETRI